MVGEEELGVMKKSAQQLHQAIKDSEIYIAPEMKHGELSLRHSAQYVELLKSFWAK